MNEKGWNLYLIFKANIFVEMTRWIGCDPNTAVIKGVCGKPTHKRVLAATANNLLQCKVSIEHRICVAPESRTEEFHPTLALLGHLAGSDSKTVRQRMFAWRPQHWIRSGRNG